MPLGFWMAFFGLYELMPNNNQDFAPNPDRQVEGLRHIFLFVYNFLYESMTINSLHQPTIGGWRDCAIFFFFFDFLYESVTINCLHQHLQIGGWKDCANFCLGNPSSCKAWTYRDEPIRCQFLAFLQVVHTFFFTILLSWGFHDLYDNFWSSYDDNQHHLISCNSS